MATRYTNLKYKAATTPPNGDKVVAKLGNSLSISVAYHECVSVSRLKLDLKHDQFYGRAE